MEKLLNILNTFPEFKRLLASLQRCESAAVTGIGQINRSHMIASLHRQIQHPLVIICQDDIAAKRMQEELKCFLGDTPPVLPSRELTLYDAAVVSRAWEQKRLRQLFDLASGRTPIQIFTWEALSQRTMPPATLLRAAFRLEVGREYPIDELLKKTNENAHSTKVKDGKL
jgi:transcription-repair coupling factor (superfamily II helicase)